LPRVLVADGGGEEFQKPLGGLLAGGGDQARHEHAERADPTGFDSLMTGS
jgi:hypothetical protein